MKKLITLLLAATLTVGLLTACGSSSSGEAAPAEDSGSEAEAE